MPLEQGPAAALPLQTAHASVCWPFFFLCVRGVGIWYAAAGTSIFIVRVLCRFGIEEYELWHILYAFA